MAPSSRSCSGQIANSMKQGVIGADSPSGEIVCEETEEREERERVESQSGERERERGREREREGTCRSFSVGLQCLL